MKTKKCEVKKMETLWLSLKMSLLVLGLVIVWASIASVIKSFIKGDDVDD